MLDSLTRTELQEVLLEVWYKEKITAMIITHDVDEAIFLSDRVVMMTNGPRAKVGDILAVDFSRPRIRKDVIEHPNYYDCRARLIDFLEGKYATKETKLRKQTAFQKSFIFSKPLDRLNIPRETQEDNLILAPES